LTPLLIPDIQRIKKSKGEPMKPITIDPEKCNRDGICVKACPAAVIELASPNELPAPVTDFKEYCLACGHCVAVCPTGAFSLDWLKTGECASISKELVLNRDQSEQFLRSRRSIRNFKDKTVEREKLEKLLEIACYAASARNNQPWHWTVVQSPADVRKMAEMVIDWMRSIIKKYPQQAGERGLPRVVESWDGGQERICRGAPHVILVHGDKDYVLGPQDSATALSYLELYAPTVGLGTCWGGYFFSAVNSYPPLFEALGLPSDHKAFGAVMVGYPKLRYQRLPLRKEPRIYWI
jgi:nitroreductase/NAD-dependent dihydropyrimidine dehydrogenase PreA subunit